MVGKKVYTELAKAKIKERRNVVISRNESNGGYALAQQIVVEEGKKFTTIFIKGATYIDDLIGLYNLRDALNEAIEKEEDTSNKKK